ncbi:diguanylate cyclase domain-containing protein [Actinoplanes sp. GCM10030250]|uniref:diguanylate cyclase domain-containing protein n=1 Tax=Actinoplanes sp. GCM10030250 TaxID=3273376 RepID=UPI003621D941
MSSSRRGSRREIVTPVIRRDRLLTAACWWTAIGILLLFLIDDTNTRVQAFWLFQVPLDVLLAYSSWRVARIATGPIRRFWRILTIAGCLFVVGDTTQTVTSFLGKDQGTTNGGVVQSICFAIGLTGIIVVMLIHPHPHRSARERMAFWLDSATVLVGGAVVAWVFTVSPENATDDGLVATIAAGAVILTAAFASVKLILSGNAPMHKAAAFPMIASAIVNGIGFFAAPSDLETALPAYVFAIRFLPSLLIAAGPRTQQIIAGFDQTAFGSRRRKRYSLLPYGSIVVVFTSMVAVLRDGFGGGIGIRVWGVVVGLGAIVALVAARQLVAFHDNTRLISELDVTLAELREHETRLRHQAHYDGLTGLANRTHFHEQVAETLEGSQTGTVSLLLIDLDGFKAVNDTLGHAAGDTLLAGVADHLNASVRTDDLVARLGGDEFAVLLRDCDFACAEQTAQRILQNLEIPVAVGGQAIRAHASIGVACATADEDVEALLREADLAMYAAKHHGKNCWRSYEPAMEAA